MARSSKATPHVCMVADHGCIRVFREAITLIQAGYTVDVISRKAPFGFNAFNTLSIFDDWGQMKRSVAASRADIFHVHNEPDKIVFHTRDATSKPIIFDCHDLQSLRSNHVSENEKKAFDASDGYIFVSETAAKLGVNTHKIKKPVAVVFSYINKQFTKPITWPANFNSVCYEGGVASAHPSFKRADGTEFVNYRNYLPIAKQFLDQDFSFTVYPASALPNKNYEFLGAVVSQPLFYPVLMRALRTHGLGIVGAHCHIPIMHAAMPNKLFEYMSQGVVPVVINCAEVAQFVEDNGCGIELKSFDNIRDQLADAPKIRERIIKDQGKWFMEKQLPVIEKLYEEVLGG